MAEFHEFNEDARKRIKEAVREVEGTPEGEVDEFRTRGSGIDRVLIGKAPEFIAKGASGLVNIYRGQVKGAEAYAAGDDKTCYARGSDISSGKWVMVCRLQGGYEVWPWEC